MKKQIPLVIYTFLACNAAIAQTWTGWNTNAWPSTNHYRVGANTQLVDMVAEYYDVSVDLHGTGKDFFSQDVGSQLNGYNPSGFVYSVKAPESGTAMHNMFVGTNAINDTNSFTAPNVVQYYRDIALGTNPPSGGGATNSYAYYVDDNILNQQIKQTNTVIWTGIATQFIAQVKDLWGIDGYLSLTDASEIGAEWLTDVNQWTTNTVTAPIPYRNNRASLLAFKQWITNNVARYADPDLDNDGLTNLLNTAGALGWTGEGLFASVGAPTNWTEYTPWRDLGGSSAGFGAVVTNSYLCPTAGTYTVTDYWGGTNNQITATASQETVTLLTTNPVILAGFTTSDYGYKHYPAIISKLTRTVDYEDDTEGYGDIVGSWAQNSGNVGSWASVLTAFDANVAATMDTITNFPTATPGAGVQTTRDAGDTTGYIYAYAGALAQHCATSTVSVTHAPANGITNMTTMLVKLGAFSGTTYRDLLQIAPTSNTWVFAATSVWDNASTKTIPTPPMPSNLSTGIPAPAEGTTNQWSQYITDRIYVTDWQTNSLPYSVTP